MSRAEQDRLAREAEEALVSRLREAAREKKHGEFGVIVTTFDGKVQSYRTVSDEKHK